MVSFAGQSIGPVFCSGLSFRSHATNLLTASTHTKAKGKCLLRRERDACKYIAVALAHDPQGGHWLTRLIGPLDELIVRSHAVPALR